jgi:hypothetical protein
VWAVLFFAALSVAVLFAFRNGVDAFVDGAARVIGPGRTKVGGVEFPAQSGYPAFQLETRRTPESWWKGGDTVAFTLKIDAVRYLKSFNLYSAEDVDDNGRVDPSEWTLLCTGSIDESSGITVATIGATHVGRGSVAYRVVTDDRQCGIWYRQWARLDLKFFDP